MKGFSTILLLALSNLFMTFAWYGHLQFKKISWLQGVGLIGMILISWGLAFFEYIFQVPANKIGSIVINVTGGDTSKGTAGAMRKELVDTMQKIADGRIANSRRPGGLMYA